MHSISQIFFCILFFCSCVLTRVVAQRNVPKYQIGLAAGASIYQGDLVPSFAGSYRTLRPALNVFASRLLSPSVAFRANLGLMSLKGDDARHALPVYRQHRNFKSETSLIELSALAEWNPLGSNYQTKGFAPYVVAGLGYSLLNIRRDWSNLDVAWFGAESTFMNNLAMDAKRRPPGGVLVIPVGIGLRYYVSDKIGFNVESTYRISNTDYLDGFSQSANPVRKDHYYTHTIGVVYRLGKKNLLDCPVVP